MISSKGIDGQVISSKGIDGQVISSKGIDGQVISSKGIDGQVISSNESRTTRIKGQVLTGIKPENESGRPTVAPYLLLGPFQPRINDPLKILYRNPKPS